MIELTVALPVFNSKEIIWLALESLSRQENVNFQWELLVVEEYNFNSFGKKSYEAYWEKYLKPKGCVRLEVMEITKWMPLSHKWRVMGTMMSDTSEIFMLQAADCYSYSERLYDTRNTFDIYRNIDWYNQEKGLFYDVNLNRMLLYSQTLLEKPMSTGLNMAFKSRYAKQLNPDNVAKGVDGWLFNECRRIKEHELSVFWNIENIYEGVDTNGLNNISTGRRNYFTHPSPPFQFTNKGLNQCVPQDIALKLLEVGDQNRENLRLLNEKLQNLKPKE